MKEYKKSDTLENYMFLKSVLDMDESLKNMNRKIFKDFLLIIVAFLLAIGSVLVPALSVVTIGFILMTIIKPRINKSSYTDFEDIDKKQKNLSECSKFKSKRIQSYEDKVYSFNPELNKYKEALAKQQEKTEKQLRNSSKYRFARTVVKPDNDSSEVSILNSYEEALEKQIEAKQTPVDEIYQIINVWYSNYPLPELDISPKKLDKFWCDFYNFLLNHEIENPYYIMQFVAGLIFQGFLSAEDTKITIIDLINGLDYLNSYNLVAGKKIFKEKDILLLQSELLNKYVKIINVDFKSK